MTPLLFGVGRRVALAAGALALSLGLSSGAAAQGSLSHLNGPKLDTQQDKILKEVRLDQKLNAQLPLDLAFKDETGKA